MKITDKKIGFLFFFDHLLFAQSYLLHHLLESILSQVDDSRQCCHDVLVTALQLYIGEKIRNNFLGLFVLHICQSIVTIQHLLSSLQLIVNLLQVTHKRFFFRLSILHLYLVSFFNSYRHFGTGSSASALRG